MVAEITIREHGDVSGLWAIDWINYGVWMTAYGLTKDEAEYFLAHFDYDEIGRKWGWV